MRAAPTVYEIFKGLARWDNRWHIFCDLSFRNHLKFGYERATLICSKLVETGNPKLSISMLPPEKKQVPIQGQSTDLSVQGFNGTTEQLQQFIQTSWTSAYSGKMSFPIWTKEYLDWQVPDDSTSNSRRLAVYDGTKPVGVLLGSPYDFRVNSETFSGAHWSWLSVDPNYRGRGIAKLLDQKRVEIEKALDSDLIVSYRFTGSKHSLAEKPSKNFPLKDFNRKIGFWARPLDVKKLAQWNPNRLEGFSSKLVSPLLPKTLPLISKGSIRKFKEDDFESCLELLQSRRNDFELSIDWNEHSLKQQLMGSDLSQTIVFEDAGKIIGLINFHSLKFQGRTQEPVGIIDIIADDGLSSSKSQALISTALGEMKNQGVILALKLKSGDSNSFALLRSGFIPRLPDSSLVFQWTENRTEINSRGRLHVLWR